MTTCDPERVVSKATRGYSGGSGGDALKGGDGGDGGSISIRYRQLDGSDKLSLNAKGGDKGVSGKPGKGARSGRGGKTYRERQGFNMATNRTNVTTSFVSQEYPTDADALPVSADGHAMADTDSKAGKDGEEKRDTLKSLAELGDVMHDMFLLMVLQSIKYRYLNCNPQSFYLPAIKPAKRDYTFFPGSKTEWTKIGDSLASLTGLLTNFQNKPSGDDNLSARRKYQIQAEAAGFTLKYNDHKTFYGNLANWVPRQTLLSIKNEFDANLKTLKSVQEEFLELARSYEKGSQQALTMTDYQTQLGLRQAYHLTAYNDAAKKIPQARDDVEAAHTSFLSAQGALSKKLTDIERAIGGRFDCRLDVIIKGVEMMAFAHGSLETAGLMAGAELASFIDEGMNNLKLADGRVVDKKYLLQQIAGLGGDLKKDFREKLLQDGKLKFDDTTTVRFMADLDKLDEQIDSVSDALGDAAADAKAAVMTFRNALAARSDAILAYNAVINTALKYRQDYVGPGPATPADRYRRCGPDRGSGCCCHRAGLGVARFEQGFEAAVVGPYLAPDSGGHDRGQEPEDAVRFGGGRHLDAGRLVVCLEAVLLAEPEHGRGHGPLEAAAGLERGDLVAGLDGPAEQRAHDAVPAAAGRGARLVSRCDCFTPTVQAGRFWWSATKANTCATGLVMITESVTWIVIRGSSRQLW